MPIAYNPPSAESKERADVEILLSLASKKYVGMRLVMTIFTATLHSRRKRQSKEYRKRMETEGIVA